MTFFSGLDFFITLIILLVPAIFLGLREKSLNLYRCLISVFFIYMVYKDTVWQFVYLCLYAGGSAYLVNLFLYLNKRHPKNKVLLWHFVIIALIPLCLSKYSTVTGTSLFCFLGISYICFRVIQVIIEIYDGLITELRLFDYLEFLLFFPSLSSGPIDRSRRFVADIKTIPCKSEYEEFLFEGSFKLVLGAFYKIVCSSLCFKLLSMAKEIAYESRNPLYFIVLAYCYGFYMFFDFAGYSSMAVGTSYILGIRMPDNFNKPFLSLDLKDFWNRWHITLSHWFRDFLFSRFTMFSIKKKLFSSRTVTAAVGLILNMGIMGLWHGFEKHYIIYGLYHGALLAFTEVYQKKSTFYKKYKTRKWFHLCSWFITLNLVMLGFLIFSGYLNPVFDMIRNMLIGKFVF